MKKVIPILIAAAYLFFVSAVSAQLVVYPNNNGQTLSQNLVGGGVLISNTTLTGGSNASGTFNGLNSNLGIGNGIVLCTGTLDAIPGPNNSSGTGLNNMLPGDADLDVVAGTTTQDACVLQFDVQAYTDSFEFQYVFGSEEFLEYVNGGYNDVFAFFVSGPGIVDTPNIALIPGTSTPVSVDSVNNNVNSQYYIDNGVGISSSIPQYTDPYYIQYDGFTTVLTAKLTGLTPFATYHLKLAVADAGDGVLDSGVFLRDSSMTTTFLTFDPTQSNLLAFNYVAEDCGAEQLKFKLNRPSGNDAFARFVLGGTAVNGIDYTYLADTLIIPAGDTLFALNIIPLPDTIAEGEKTIKIYLVTNTNNIVYDSVTFLLVDTLPLQISNGVAICPGEDVAINATGANSYSWMPAAGLTAADISNPVAAPAVTTTYVCTAFKGNCTITDSLTITVNQPTFIVDAGSDINACGSSQAQLNSIVSGSPTPGYGYAYVWSPAVGLSDTTITNPIAFATSTTQQYVLQVTSGLCKSTDTIYVFIDDLAVVITATDETCTGCQDASASVSVSGGQAPFTYEWENGNSSTGIGNLSAGLYTVTVSDAAGCSVTANVSVALVSGISYSPSEVIQVYPNPISNYAFVQYASAANEQLNISIYNTEGKQLRSEIWLTTTGNNNHALNLSSYAAGVYIVKLTSADKSVFTRLVKE